MDTSEPPEPKSELRDIGVERDLPAGDYIWLTRQGRRVGWERKSISDLLASLGSGRLADQLRRLAQEVEIPGLLWEGPLEVDHYGNLVDAYWTTRDGRRVRVPRSLNWNLRHLQGALYAYARLLGLNLVYSPGIEWTGRILRWLFEWDQKGYHPGIYARRRRDLYVPTRSAVALAEIVGPKRAHLMLAEFGSLRGVLMAGPDQLRQVRGIGPDAINRLRRVLDEPYDPSRSIFSAGLPDVEDHVA
jgi:ERCC4-type nuclease